MLESPEHTHSPPPQDTSQEEKERVPTERCHIERLPEAPLVERKLYLAKPVSVFPTQQDLLNYKSAKVRFKARGIVVTPGDFNARLVRTVPTQVGVIRQDENGFHVAKSNGESLGWVDIESSKVYEWSTNYVFVPKSRDRSERPAIFASKPDALRDHQPQPFPDELWDKDIIFPLLELDRKQGLYLIGHPLPRTVQTDLVFPLWIKREYPTTSQQQLLVDPTDIERAKRNIEFLRRDFEALHDDPDARADAESIQPFLNAYQSSMFALITGNSCLTQADTKKQSQLIQKTVSFFKEREEHLFNGLYLTAHDFRWMSDPDFDIWLRQKLDGNVFQFSKDLNSDVSYSVFKDGKPVKRMIVDPW